MCIPSTQWRLRLHAMLPVGSTLLQEVGVGVWENPAFTPLSPSDVSGKIRIWDTTQKEHILKYEYQPIAGVIKDIAWSPDSKRIAVCGEGREK